MSCNAFDRDHIVSNLQYFFEYLRSWVGVDAIAYALIGLGALVLGFLFRWTLKLVIPVLAEWIERYINSRARETFNDNALQFEGFRFRTCVLSVCLGLAFML